MLAFVGIRESKVIHLEQWGFSVKIIPQNRERTVWKTPLVTMVRTTGKVHLDSGEVQEKNSVQLNEIST